jgi:hypothetical protein
LKTFFGWSLISGAALITICSILVYPFGNVKCAKIEPRPFYSTRTSIPQSSRSFRGV